MRLPENEAGRLVARGIEAAGGWERWWQHEDVAFVSTLALFDPAGRAVSETIFLHRLPLHGEPQTRLDSVGLAEEVVYGFDGDEDWMLRDGRAVQGIPGIAFTRFHALSSMYLFRLPFMLAEVPATLSYEGQESLGTKRWEKVRAVLEEEAAPFDWLVLYFDAERGLLDRVLLSVRAEFLDHRLWVGRWIDYREAHGVKQERRRTFYPANGSGRVTGPMAAEQLVEHVRFGNRFWSELVEPPLPAAGGSPAG
jgi:hypothetical protein